MMFGLPAACLAMYRNALPERRKLMGGILLSMALTSFLTGVTEPIEFAFIFLAPLLYGLHALLTGLSMAITNLLDIHLGFTFSGGAIDMALGWGKSTNGWLIFPVGLVYGLLYYLVFDYCIRRFNLKTPGREAVASSDSPVVADSDRAGAYIQALGGATNVLSVGACTTRLRLQLADRDQADDARLKALGAMGVVRPGHGGSLQVIVGPLADSLADEIRLALPAAAKPMQPLQPWLQALGGAANIDTLECLAVTRLRVQLNGAPLDLHALKALGCQGSTDLGDGTWHLLVGEQAQGLSQALQPLLARREALA